MGGRRMIATCAICGFTDHVNPVCVPINGRYVKSISASNVKPPKIWICDIHIEEILNRDL